MVCHANFKIEVTNGCLVDIRAKTDVYVGLLPANSLERLLEKRPIVLLTLAKRLISLLSPLGMFMFAVTRTL